MDTPGLTPLAELKKAIIDQKKAFLPLQVEDPTLALLHDSVTTYDQLVSQVVIGAIQGWTVEISPVQIQETRNTIQKALETPEIQGNRRVEIYRSYVTRLDRMLQLADQVLKTG